MSQPSPKKPTKGRLKPRERKFAAEYLIDSNGMRAAIRAGVPPRGAATWASEILKKPEVQELIEAGVERLRKKAEAKAARENEKYDDSVERWLAEVNALAYSDMDQFVQVGERAISIIPTEDRRVSGRAIAKVSESKGKNGTQRSIQLHNKLSALELLAKHKGYIKDRQVLEGNADNPVQVKVNLPANGREAPVKKDDSGSGSGNS